MCRCWKPEASRVARVVNDAIPWRYFPRACRFFCCYRGRPLRNAAAAAANARPPQDAISDTRRLTECLPHGLLDIRYRGHFFPFLGCPTWDGGHCVRARCRLGCCCRCLLRGRVDGRLAGGESSGPREIVIPLAFFLRLAPRRAAWSNGSRWPPVAGCGPASSAAASAPSGCVLGGPGPELRRRRLRCAKRHR